jgi:hypothetical protein
MTVASRQSWADLADDPDEQLVDVDQSMLAAQPVKGILRKPTITLVKRTDPPDDRHQ